MAIETSRCVMKKDSYRMTTTGAQAANAVP